MAEDTYEEVSFDEGYWDDYEEDDGDIKTPPEERMPWTRLILMTSVAFAFELPSTIISIAAYFGLVTTGILGVVGWIITTILSFYSFLTFFIWWKIADVSLTGTRKAIIRLFIYLGLYLLDLVPILELLPFETIAVLLICLDVRAEDKLRLRKYVEYFLKEYENDILKL
jgi:hypothetical protein